MWRFVDGKRGKTRGVIAGLVPAISIRMAQRSIIGMAGTSPAMTKWEMPRVLPLLRYAAIGSAGMNAKLMEAVAAFRAGRPDQAEKLVRDIVRKRPNDVDAQRMIGFLCNQTGRHAEAVEHFDLVLRLNRKQPQIHYLRGISLLALNRHQDALESFNGALAVDGPQADTYVN